MTIMKPISFELPQGVDFSGVVSDGTTRFSATEFALLSGAMLLASNGRIAAVTPLDEHAYFPDEAPLLLLHGDMLVAESHKPMTVNICDDGQHALRKPLPKCEGRFPPFAAIFPENIDGRICLSLDIVLLTKLAAAMSPSGLVSLFIKPPKEGEHSSTDPVCVVGFNNTDEFVRGIGMIMPLTPDPKSHESLKARYAACRERLPKEAINFPLEQAKDGKP